MTSFCNWRAPVPLSFHIHTRIPARIYCPHIRKSWGQKKIFSILPHILTAQLVKNPSAIQETPVQFLGWEDPLEKGWLPTPVFLGFPCGLAGQESTCNVGDLGSIPGLGRLPGEGKGYPLHYSGLENSMDCIVYGVANSQTQLNKFHFHFHILPNSS